MSLPGKESERKLMKYWKVAVLIGVGVIVLIYTAKRRQKRKKENATSKL
jgi:hypothetical protein